MDKEWTGHYAGRDVYKRQVYNKNYKLPAAAEHVRELIIEKYELQKQSLQ